MRERLRPHCSKGSMTMLDFRMETFLCVCRCMNFTRASEELHITQPAVSQQIRFLEKHYKTKLFCYEGKRLMLTDAGRMLKNAAAAMMQDELELQERMLTSEEGIKEIRLGATKTAAETVMPKLMHTFLTRYPQIQLHMEVEMQENLLAELDRGELDFVLTEEYFPKGEYDFFPYIRVRLIAVCASGYPIGREPVNLEELFKERLLIREEDAGARKALECYLGSQNHSLQEFIKTVEIGDYQTMKELTKTGCGITFLYETSVARELAQGEVKEIVLNEFNVVHDLHFIWRKGSIYANLYREMFQQFSSQEEELQDVRS